MRSLHPLCLAMWGEFLFVRDGVAALRGPRTAGKLFLPIAFLIWMQAANGQSLRQALEPRLARLSSKSHSAVLLWDLPRSETLAAVQEEVFAARGCLGSLVKPFLLLAYLKELNERCSNLASHPPEVPPCPRADELLIFPAPLRDHAGSALQPCVGRATPQCPVECWYKPGHRKLEMSRALAVSCNQYFYQLSEQTSPAAFFKTLAALGLSPSGELAAATSVPPETMIGLDSSLRLVPLQELKAYGSLISGHPSAEMESFPSPAFA